MPPFKEELDYDDNPENDIDPDKGDLAPAGDEPEAVPAAKKSTEEADNAAMDAAAEADLAAAAEQKAAKDALDGLPEVFSEEDLAFLSEAEREAILADQEAEAAEVPEAPEVPQTAAPEAKEAPKEPDPVELLPPINTAEIEAKLATLAAKRKELNDAYDDGDLTRDGLDNALSDLEDEIVEAKADLRIASKENERREQAAQAAQEKVVNAWYDTVDAYMDRYPALKSDAHIQGFDQALKAVNRDPVFSKLPADQRIRLAHEDYARRAVIMGAALPAEAAPNAQVKPTPAAKTTQKPAAPKAPPPTLASIPASDTNETGAQDPRFAAIDRMIAEGDVAGSEQALAKLSQRDLDAYLS